MSQRASEHGYEMGDVAREAAEIVSQKRDTHGDAVENHRHIAAMWSAFLGVPIEPWEVAMMMTDVKKSRAKMGVPIRDHFTDTAGYADVGWSCVVADEAEAADGHAVSDGGRAAPRSEEIEPPLQSADEIDEMFDEIKKNAELEQRESTKPYADPVVQPGSVYLAGSVQHSEDGGHGWRDDLATRFPGVDWVNPLDKYDVNVDNVRIVSDGEEILPEDSRWETGDQVVRVSRLVRDDKAMIDASEAVFRRYDDGVPAEGSAQETIYAAENGKTVVTHLANVTGDRPSAWVEHHSDYMSESLAECIAFLATQLDLELGPTHVGGPETGEDARGEESEETGDDTPQSLRTRLDALRDVLVDGIAEHAPGTKLDDLSSGGGRELQNRYEYHYTVRVVEDSDEWSSTGYKAREQIRDAIRMAIFRGIGDEDRPPEGWEFRILPRDTYVDDGETVHQYRIRAIEEVDD